MNEDLEARQQEVERLGKKIAREQAFVRFCEKQINVYQVEIDKSNEFMFSLIDQIETIALTIKPS